LGRFLGLVSFLVLFGSFLFGLVLFRWFRFSWFYLGCFFGGGDWLCFVWCSFGCFCLNWFHLILVELVFFGLVLVGCCFCFSLRSVVFLIL